MKNAFSKDGIKIALIGFIVAGISVGLYLWFVKTPTFKIFEIWVQGNLILFYLFLVLTKALAIVWPPLPGNLFTFASIPFWGWFVAYTADFTGSIIGSSIAFFLGKKYGYKFINKIFSGDIEEKIRRIKVRPNREIESVFMLKTIGGGMIMEAVCYGAGLLNVKYKNFLIGSAISHVVFGIPLFFLANQLFETKNVFMVILLAIVSIFVVYKVKGRYFE